MQITAKQKKHVLICPLDWGLGHASRILPVVKQFINAGYFVSIGGSGLSGTYLRMHFPELPYIAFPSVTIRYPARKSLLIVSIILKLPQLFFSVWREHLFLNKIIASKNIQVVVSDNRYGLFSNKAYTIFITHQLSPVLPRGFHWAEFPLYKLICFLIRRFDECWIPDYADQERNLTGKLSHRFRLPENATYIGILSRFSSFDKPASDQGLVYDRVVVLSGPQPALMYFTDKIIRQIRDDDNNTLVVTGFQTTGANLAVRKSTPIVPHLDIESMGNALLNARLIFCRSGYSSIMDLVALGKTAILIPTPGQPEQEYLAQYMNEKGLFRIVSEKDFSLYSFYGIPSALLPQMEQVSLLSETIACLKNKYNDHYHKTQKIS